MKVIDLPSYRKFQEIKTLERRIAENCLSSKTGSSAEIKMCFREWLKATKRDGKNLQV
jgi:hypothetical protein